MNTVLVYGTLRPFKNEEIVMVPGKLYDLGWYPGILLGGDCGDPELGPADGEGYVTCERIHVSEERLRQLDNYEGYDPEYPEQSLYLREKVGEDWIYTYNRSFRGRPVVESGDWEQYTKQKEVV